MPVGLSATRCTRQQSKLFENFTWIFKIPSNSLWTSSNERMQQTELAVYPKYSSEDFFFLPFEETNLSLSI